ncbi:phosphate transport system regulatory protein PhoU [Bacteriovorax sp. BSW11_IV]|uniref:phosphate signaling complex protein PhoU n=1 Tax=Bacteriovorax sp. BSW11_IV TaxID=1353529 RepID=UPI000389E9D7|nr:phosphate signaling complex protein PhoU [Bacteriovorax sp. BSW11_IV]EQC49142.1 phosphate transport system regulatory protein PhoU [Bacteriovorax sp. BSW11_IV]
MKISSSDIKEMAANMAKLVEKSLIMSMEVDMALSDILEIEREVNNYHKEIDDAVFKYLALKNPHAKDLRIAIAVMKMNSELERIADQSVSIKRYSKKFTNEYKLISALFKTVLSNYQDSLTAFANSDVRLASEVIKFDENINEINRDVISESINQIQEGKIEVDEALAIMRVSKNLERIGDHITNIAEDIIFLESGDDIRHNPNQ